MKNSSLFLMLRDIDLLKSLSDNDLEKMANHTNIIRIKNNEKVYDYGQRAQNVYIVHKGSIKLGITTEDEKTLIKDIAYDGDVFGENIFVNDGVRKEFAKSIKESAVLQIPLALFKSMVENNPAFAQSIMRVILKRIQALEVRMESFIFKKARKRIVEFLTKMADIKGLKIGMDEILINHGMSHKEIAYLTDTSRQTVARVMGELKKANFIHFSARKPNKVLIRNIAALA